MILYLFIYLLTYCMSRALLEKLTGFQLVKKFPEFYGTRFITAITRAHHLSLYWAGSIQSIPPHPTSWRSILILSSDLRLGLPSGLSPSGFPTKILYTPLFSTKRGTCHAHWFYHLNNVGWEVQCPPKDTRIKYFRCKEQGGLHGAPEPCCSVKKIPVQHSNHNHRGKNYRIHNTIPDFSLHDANVLDLFLQTLYMFQAVPPPIIRST